MGFIFGVFKRLFKLFIFFLIFAAIIVLIPNLPPYTNFTSIPFEPTQLKVGPLAPNGALNNAEKAYVDKLLGPEAFQLHKGELYTSLATGEIVKLSPGGHFTFVTKIGKPCTSLVQEHICGRPLGFEIDEKNNAMYVADAYLGIWKVDLKNDKKQLLVSPSEAIEGRTPKIFNSVALAKNGDLYWTDSSSEFHLKDGAYSLLTDPSGRLFHYSAAKRESKVLLDDLWFANGVVISPDNKFVIVAETARLRLLKYYINGPNKGKSEVFVAGLPGMPDNLRSLPDGSGVLVSLYTSFDEEDPIVVRSLSEAPLARKFAARMQRLVEIAFEYLNSVFPHPLLEDVVYYIGHFKSTSSMAPKKSGLIQIDWNGNIVAAYYNTDGTLGHISDAIVFDNRLYTGSPHLQNFLGSVPVPPFLKKAFEPSATKQQAKPAAATKPKVEEKPKVEVKREAPKPAQEKLVQPKQTKPVETAKPTTQPPVEKKTVKPEAPKPTTTPPPPKTEPPKAQPKQEAKPTPKPAPVTTPPPSPKPVVKVTPAPAQPAKAVPEAKPTPKPEAKKPAETKQEQVKPKETQKPVKEQPKPEQIPIREEIPSDTAKPPKETLKVIKKGGPAEIPNPNV